MPRRAHCALLTLYAMALAHQNLAVAVGAAKEHARTVLQQFEHRGDARTGRSSSVYLALMVLHKRVLATDPPPVQHFIPDLEHITRACGDKLASVKPLVEAALGVARDTPDQA